MVNRGNSYSSGMGFEKESVQSLWREAMVLRDLARDGVTDSRERRAEAEAARRAAEQEALKATEEFCHDLRARAEGDLEKASNTLVEAEQLKNEIEADLDKRMNAGQADIQARQDDVETQLARAETTRDEAEGYARNRRKEAEAIISDALAAAEQTAQEARTHADGLISTAHSEADEIREEMRRQTAGEIRALVSDVEAARSAVLEELETQRILNETARIRATSPGLNAKVAAAAKDLEHTLRDSASVEFEETAVEQIAEVEPELILLVTEEPVAEKSSKKSVKRPKKRPAAKAKKQAA